MVVRAVDEDALRLTARDLRISVLDMLAHAGSGHSAGPLGMAEIMSVIYFHALVHDPANPEWPDRDVFMLSHGHTAPILYAALAHAGYFPTDELASLRSFGSRLQGHPERLALPGLETTSGPLGCGLSQGAGYAFAADRLQNAGRKRFVYVAMGDGELNEGNIWEAAMFAAKYDLGNLIGIVDRNYIQIDGATETVMPLGDLAGKWRSFGWHVVEVDGHSIPALIDAIGVAKATADRPSVILANTVPGKGVDYMEYDHRWHGRPPTREQADEAIAVLRGVVNA